MIWLLWTTVAISVLLHWLYKVNKEYYVLAFFARRVRAKDGRPLENIVPIPKGATLFANCFDLFGKDPGEQVVNFDIGFLISIVLGFPDQLKFSATCASYQIDSRTVMLNIVSVCPISILPMHIMPGIYLAILN